MNPNPNPNPTFRKNESQSQSQSQKFSNSIPIPIPIPKFSEFNPNPNPKNSTKSQTIPRNFWDPNPKNIFMENVLNRKKERNSSKTKQNPCSKVLEPERFYFNECFLWVNEKNILCSQFRLLLLKMTLNLNNGVLSLRLQVINFYEIQFIFSSLLVLLLLFVSYGVFLRIVF